MNQSAGRWSGRLLRKCRSLRESGPSELEPGRAQDLVRTQLRIDRFVGRRRQMLGEPDFPAAADATAERLQPIGGGRAVAREPAGLATGRRFAALVQRAANVPSLCSSAFEVFCPAGSVFASVIPGPCAYG